MHFLWNLKSNYVWRFLLVSWYTPLCTFDLELYSLMRGLIQIFEILPSVFSNLQQYTKVRIKGVLFHPIKLWSINVSFTYLFSLHKYFKKVWSLFWIQFIQGHYALSYVFPCQKRALLVDLPISLSQRKSVRENFFENFLGTVLGIIIA